MDTPRTSNELKEIATKDYGLNWKTISDINSRLVWLRQLGLVDFQEFSLLYSITETGKGFLKHVKVVELSQISHQEDETAVETNLHIDSWAINYCNLDQQHLSTRKQSIGYIPGNIADFKETIYEYLCLIESGANYDDIKEYDPITEGFLLERDVYRSLRDNIELGTLPTIEEISNMLQFLASPLIGCVEKTKDGYYATGSLSDAARKFTFYSRFCAESDDI